MSYLAFFSGTGEGDFLERAVEVPDVLALLLGDLWDTLGVKVSDFLPSSRVGISPSVSAKCSSVLIN